MAKCLKGKSEAGKKEAEFHCKKCGAMTTDKGHVCSPAKMEKEKSAKKCKDEKKGKKASEKAKKALEKLKNAEKELKKLEEKVEKARKKVEKAKAKLAGKSA